MVNFGESRKQFLATIFIEKQKLPGTDNCCGYLCHAACNYKISVE